MVVTQQTEVSEQTEGATVMSELVPAIGRVSRGPLLVGSRRTLENRNVLIPYREKDHGSFNDEWPSHRGANDWWYVTGYLHDVKKPEILYSYQFTVINVKHFGKMSYLLHVAFTDMQTGAHVFERRLRLANRKTFVNGDTVSFVPFSLLQRGANEMNLMAKTKDLELNLRLNIGKGAFWHADNGVLVMGLPDDDQQRTVYYSYTNMPTSGTVSLTGASGRLELLEVKGKSWFDRQWGPFRIFNTDSFWEWFSIRFFDDEEVMLFAFPQHPYVDGTYIDKGGKTRLIRNYKYDCHKLKDIHGAKFSEGWDVTLPGIKEEFYRITPMAEGQYNAGYFELIARVTNRAGVEVGYCFVELLPGVRQEGKLKFNFLSLLRKN
jgi:predicted secreted hydrolase